MSLMSSRALATIQRTTERWMVDEIQVWRGTSSSHNEDTLVESTVSGEKIYEGKARVGPSRGARELAVSEGVMALRDADILLPLDAPTLRRDDEIKVISSQDPQWEGTWLRITDVRVASQQAARRFSAVAAQPSRLWPLEASDGD